MLSRDCCAFSLRAWCAHTHDYKHLEPLRWYRETAHYMKLGNKIADMNDYEFLKLIDDNMTFILGSMEDFVFSSTLSGRYALEDDVMSWCSNGVWDEVTFDEVAYGDALFYSADLNMFTNHLGCESRVYFCIKNISNGNADIVVFDDYCNSRTASLSLKDAENDVEVTKIIENKANTLLLDLVKDTASCRLYADIHL